jgi:hypothetical protein
MYNDDYKFPDFMNLASFWMNDIPDSNELILSLDKIKEFNTKLKPIITSVYSLEDDEDAISSKILIEYIKSYELPSKDMYDLKGKLVSSDYYEKIILNTNMDGIKKYATVKYGITSQKTSVRSFPVVDPIFSCTEHSKINNFDRFQETGCLACEPVLIFHESLDKEWYFVKLYNYFGWIKTDDIAIAKDKNQIFDYANCRDFLMVTGKEVTIIINEKDFSTKLIKCGMGTKLCCLDNTEFSLVENHMVKFPCRDNRGELFFITATISKNEDVIKGTLPYTRYNIINQALKFIDTPYDWGDKFSGKDCSSFILTIYKCFGFLLPRNTDDQESSFTNAENSIQFISGDNLQDRYAKIDKLKAGAALFMQGHVMMYLGKYMGMHYMIQSFAGYSIKMESIYEARTALLVAISTVDLLSASGIPFIQKFTSSVQYN